MKKIITYVAAALTIFALAGCSAKAEETQQPETSKTETNTETPPNTEREEDAPLLQAQLPQEGDEIAVIQTNKGEIRVQFFPEQAPKAVENFKTHAKEGYFDGLTFHRVINDFMIQGGDPTGTGMGGESIWGEDFADEPSDQLYFFRGALAMANAGPNTNGSQFFIVQNQTVPEDLLQILRDAKTTEEDGDTMGNRFVTINEMKRAFTNSALEFYGQNGGSIELESVFSGSVYTIFGQVYSGIETVDAIAVSETGERDKPTEDIIIEKITIEPYQSQA